MPRWPLRDLTLFFSNFPAQRNRAIYGYSDDEDDFDLDDSPSRSEPIAPPPQPSGMEEAAKAYEARRAEKEDSVLAQRVNATEDKPEKVKNAQLPACFQGSDDEDEDEEGEENRNEDEEHEVNDELIEGHGTAEDFADTARGTVSYEKPRYTGEEPARGTAGPTWGAGEEVKPGERKVVFDPR